MCDLKIVTVDSRGRSSSDIEGYTEHTCALSHFKTRIAGHRNAICHKSKVAALCGLNIKLYFHKNDNATTNVENRNDINRAATLLTLDPDTGFAKYHIRGIAYVVMNDGLAPLSLNQVWGIVELISDACDYYICDPDHEKRGKRELIKNCKLYLHQSWGPLSIYKNREERSTLNFMDIVDRNDTRKHLVTQSNKNRVPFSTIQT